MTTNHRRERSRITRKRLAQDLAKCVQAYLEELGVGGPMVKSICLSLILFLGSWNPFPCPPRRYIYHKAYPSRTSFLATSNLVPDYPFKFHEYLALWLMVRVFTCIDPKPLGLMFYPIVTLPQPSIPPVMNIGFSRRKSEQPRSGWVPRVPHSLVTI